MPSARWSHRLALALLPALLALPLVAGSARAGYQATIDSNESAFEPPCIGWDDPYPEKMLKAAVSAYAALGYTARGYSGTGFTRAHVLARTVNDWGYYVHSHGDNYWHAADGRRYGGFREDGGDCSQAVVYSKDIASKRAGRTSNLVVMSTCHLGESTSTMPGAFGIARTKSEPTEWLGSKFYLGYAGTAYDNDEWTFEQTFWDQLRRGMPAGFAFDTALLGNFTHPFDPNWWGTYAYSGRAGPLPPCDRCL